MYKHKIKTVSRLKQWEYNLLCRSTLIIAYSHFSIIIYYHSITHALHGDVMGKINLSLWEKLTDMAGTGSRNRPISILESWSKTTKPNPRVKSGSHLILLYHTGKTKGRLWLKRPSPVIFTPQGLKRPLIKPKHTSSVN